MTFLQMWSKARWAVTCHRCWKRIDAGQRVLVDRGQPNSPVYLHPNCATTEQVAVAQAELADRAKALWG